MKSEADARALAEAMLELGRRADREVVCLISDMDQPLGHAVGNALEIREAIATLRGEGPPDFTELVVTAAGQLLARSDLGVDQAEGRELAERSLTDGSALAAYERWIAAQGGEPAESTLPSAPVVREVQAERDGHVARLGAIRVGQAAVRLGAGRRTKDDEIDHAVGIVCRKKRGDPVVAGETLAEIHARDEGEADAVAGEVLDAYQLADAAPSMRRVVLDLLS
jgi:pyrimidine-nucleoside phosphorylase